MNNKVYSHLNEDTNQIMGKSKRKRLEWCRLDHFISYGDANKILNYLEWVITQPQKPNADLDSLSIIGKTGMGKTTIVNKFKEDHNNESNHGSKEEHTVAHCVLPDADLGLKGLYISILHADPFNYPIKEEKLKKYTVFQLEKACINLLKTTGVRILFVDEIQHVLSKRITTTLNSLKRVVLLSGVPLVPVGTDKARSVFLLDEQLADRCPTKRFSNLKGWTYDIEFKKFLAGYEQFLPFPEPSNLSSDKFALRIFSICTYKENEVKLVNLRSVSRLIKAISAMTLKDNGKHITIEYLDKYEDLFK